MYVDKQLNTLALTYMCIYARTYIYIFVLYIQTLVFYKRALASARTHTHIHICTYTLSSCTIGELAGIMRRLLRAVSASYHMHRCTHTWSYIYVPAYRVPSKWKKPWFINNFKPISNLIYSK